MKVRKAIIPAAGLGTRVLPASKSVPKEMLNIVDKPAIQYIVEEAVAAGIEDNTVVSIQIPKRNVDDVINDVEKGDRIILKNLAKDLEKKVKIESVNAFGVPGVIIIQGTFDTRTGD